MQIQAQQLNKMTLIKALVALLIVISVLIVGTFSIIYSARSAGYKSAVAAYSGWSENLASAVETNREQNGIDIDFTAPMSQQQAELLFADGYNDFEGVALISPSGFVLYEFGSYLGGRIPDGVILPDEGTGVSVVDIGGKSLAFSVTRVGDYLVGGYIDFSESAQAIADMQASAITISIFSAIVIIAAFIIYVVSLGLNERGHRYKYKIVTDLEGKILSSNKAFQEDFPQALRIYDNVSHFSEEQLNAIKLPNFDEEVFVACAAKKTTGGKVKLSADRLAMPYNAQATQPRDMMREAYISFLPSGNAFLIGNIFFADLNSINGMFGKEFAENIHSLLYEKVAKRFTYIYDLDLYNLGVLFPGGKDYEILLQDLKEIVDDLNQPLKVDNNIVNVTVKCGFAICDNMMAQRSFEYAMTAADAALRRTMHEKLKDYYIFHGSDIKNYAKYFFNYDIRQMLEEGMFEMEYQPQYGIEEGRIIGFEALFRVKKSANVFVNIFDLITYAERSGYMMYIGDFIFDTVMKFAKRVEDKNISVSVNVSPVQLMQAGFCQNFLEIYDRYNIKPGVLCVEITESFLVSNFEDAVKKLKILNHHGIEIHLDDFGTRYSSLAYLKKLPVQVIKIDREFIIDVAEDEYDRSIIEMIVNICRRHKLHSVAEGVETREQFNAMKDLGVNVIQGFLIGKSVPEDEAFRLITEFKLRLPAPIAN